MGYARVSTRRQDAARQIDALQTAGGDRIFADIGSGSVKAETRVALPKALALARPGDVRVIEDLDRRGRSLSDLGAQIRMLHARAMDFVCLRKHIDTAPPEGRLFFPVFAASAECERDLMRPRVPAGVDAARVRGRSGGRPRVLTPQALQRAAALMAAKTNRTRDIAPRAGVSRPTLYRHLTPDGEPRSAGSRRILAAPLAPRPPQAPRS